MSNDPVDRSMLAFLVGAALGAGLALLLAPKSGEETRRQLADAAKNLRDDAESKFGEAGDAVRGSAATIRHGVGEAIAAGKEAYDAARDAAGRIKA